MINLNQNGIYDNTQQIYKKKWIDWLWKLSLDIMLTYNNMKHRCLSIIIASFGHVLPIEEK